jgi:hypothetical protein
VREESCNYRFLFGLEAKRNGEKKGGRTEQSQPGKKRNTRSSLLHSLSEQYHKDFMFYACFVDFDGRLLHLLIPLTLAIESVLHILS